MASAQHQGHWIPGKAEQHGANGEDRGKDQ